MPPIVFAELAAAEDRLARRRRSVPVVQYDPALPIAARREEISRAILEHQIIVVCGETGSGKTTQLPKICLELGRGVRGMIGHTQPRRIAARSVAARIAAELNVPPGPNGPVGYSVRFTDRSGPDTLVRVMTDGVLLAETARDRLLLAYDTIIIDEAHERSLNIDFLLGYFKQLLPQRSDLKVIVTSATIDPQRFSRHFNDAPIIEVSGRMHPVEIRYEPVEDPVATDNASNESKDLDEDDPATIDAIARAIEATRNIGGDPSQPNDVLVFLSGEREIREAARRLNERFAADDLEILPLYARLSADEQNRIFQPHERRRIVLATNVAETSLTVPGIRAVVDPGLARISRYSANARVQRLPIERISQASAQQRAGRCGRIARGICIRLYSEEDFLNRPAFTDPEILRSNLASVILQMKALRLGQIEDFPFLDRPRATSVREGLQTLHELGAIDEQENLTPIGRQLARLPVDPRIGRMILQAQREGSVHEVLIIAAALTAQDPRLRPLEHSSLADSAHAEFADERSDFLAFLNLWRWWHEQAGELSSNRMRRLCEARFLSYVRMREWLDVHRQLHALAMTAGLIDRNKPAAPQVRENPPGARRNEAIHRALLAGLLSNVGMKSAAFEYQGVSDRRFAIFPGSALFKVQPRWIMAAELVETTRLYARTIARINPEWIEPLAGHLVKRTYSAPYWNRASAHVEAHERVTLRGLTIIARRRVHYGRVDPALARETFIQHALVDAEYDPPRSRTERDNAESPLKHNRELIATLRACEHRTRRKDVLLGPQAIYGFYDARLPADVCNGPSFEKWRRRMARRAPEALRMQRSDVMRAGAALADEDQFPDAMDIAGVRFPLRYLHDPGHADDGITMIVPREALRQVREERCEWLVPGLLEEKVTALIRALPKHLRVNFVPAPDYAAEAVRNMTFGVGVLTEAIARELDRSTGVRITPDAWAPHAAPAHLRMNFHVVAESGEILARGRDLDDIRSSILVGAAPGHDARIEHASGAVAHESRRSGLTYWDFGDMPERLSVSRAGVDVPLFPALLDEGETIGLRLFDSEAAAARSHREGLRRLFVLQVRDELIMHVEYLAGLEQMALQYAPFGDAESLKRDLVDLIADRVFLREDADVRTEEEFRRRLEAGWDQLWTASANVADLVARILAAYHDVDLRLSGAEDNSFLAPAANDIRAQLRHLTGGRFLVNTPFRWLQEYPRFFNAIIIRLQKLTNAGVKRDSDSMLTIRELWERYAPRHARNQTLGRVEPQLEGFRWLLEELRVSLFASELRTSVPVSPARLEKAWASLP